MREYNGPGSELMDKFYDRVTEHYPGWLPDTVHLAREIKLIDEEHKAEIEGYKNGQTQLQSICDSLQDSISKYAAERKSDKAEIDRLAAENKRMRVALLTISEGYIFDAKGIALDALTELPSPEVQQTEG